MLGYVHLLGSGVWDGLSKLEGASKLTPQSGLTLMHCGYYVCFSSVKMLYSSHYIPSYQLGSLQTYESITDETLQQKFVTTWP